MTTFSNNVTLAGNLTQDMRIVSTNATLKDGSPFMIGEGTLAIRNHGQENAAFIPFQVVGYKLKSLIDAGKTKKGSNIGIFGSLVTEVNENKETGKKYYNTRVKADDVMFGEKFFGTFNNIVLYGHASEEPQYQEKGNISYCRMSVGNTVYNPQLKERVSSFFNVTGFSHRAKFMKDYFHKGDALMIQGRLHSHSYEKTMPDGSTKKVSRIDIVANEIAFAQRKKEDAAATQNNVAEEQMSFNPSDPYDASAPFYGDGVDYSDPVEVPVHSTPDFSRNIPEAGGTSQYDLMTEDLPF